MTRPSSRVGEPVLRVAAARLAFMMRSWAQDSVGATFAPYSRHPCTSVVRDLTEALVTADDTPELSGRPLRVWELPREPASPYSDTGSANFRTGNPAAVRSSSR